MRKNTSSYAKRTCKDCSIKMYVPDMHQVVRTPKGVDGRLLPMRSVWLCSQCYRSVFHNQRLACEHEDRLKQLRDASKQHNLEKPHRRKRLTAEEALELHPEIRPPSVLGASTDVKIGALGWLVIVLMIALLGAVIGGLIWLFVTGKFKDFLVGAAIFGILFWLFPIKK